MVFEYDAFYNHKNFKDIYFRVIVASPEEHGTKVVLDFINKKTDQIAVRNYEMFIADDELDKWGYGKYGPV